MGSARCRGFDLDLELWKGQSGHAEKRRSGEIVTEKIGCEWSEHSDQLVDVSRVVVDPDDIRGGESSGREDRAEILKGLLPGGPCLRRKVATRLLLYRSARSR
jgi:hypothetical protein